MFFVEVLTVVLDCKSKIAISLKIFTETSFHYFEEISLQRKLSRISACRQWIWKKRPCV